MKLIDRIRAAGVRSARKLSVAINRRSRDLLGVVGVVCIGVGLATVSVALGLVVTGAILVFVAGAGRRSAS